MKAFRMIVVCGTALSLASCAGTPMGPTVNVLPPQGKPFDQFQFEQSSCKEYANEQVRGQAENANNTGILEGVGGTVLGAGLGAAIGGGRGAAIGAASGAVAGTAVGASTSGNKQGGIQVQYNNAYEQCMAAKGNKIQTPVVNHTVVYAPPPQPTVVYVQQPPPPTVVYETAPPPSPGYYGGPPPY